jgi:hypothetical protein
MISHPNPKELSTKWEELCKTYKTQHVANKSFFFKHKADDPYVRLIHWLYEKNGGSKLKARNLFSSCKNRKEALGALTTEVNKKYTDYHEGRLTLDKLRSGATYKTIEMISSHDAPKAVDLQKFDI